MNTQLQSIKINGHSFVSWALIVIMVLYTLGSYPMMYPGYDFSTHLNAIKDPNIISNNFWHLIWSKIFAIAEIDDNSTIRAIIIHRSQTLITLTLITASAYIYLDAAFQRLGVNAKIQLSIMATTTWLIMHGTYSSPAGTPLDQAKHIQSWLQWYSVNYQITLPMFIFASSTLLKSIISKDIKINTFWSAITLINVYLIARIHAAEVVYFIFIAIGIFIIYVIPTQRWNKLLIVCAALAAATQLGLSFTNRQPMIFEYIHPSRWTELIDNMNAYGHLIVGENLNRSHTSWHSLYSISLLATICTIFYTKNIGAIRIGLLITFSSLMAIGIQIHHTAGILALVIGEYVTWRFCFSSLLFLGLPLTIGSWIENQPAKYSSKKISIIIICTQLAIIIAISTYSKKFEPLSPTYNFLKSIAKSMNPKLSHIPNTDE